MATFLGLPKDVGLADLADIPTEGWGRRIKFGPSGPDELEKAAELITKMHKPLLILGMQASDPDTAEALKTYVRHSGIPYASTFQGPGAWVAPEQYVGKLGLFRNQPADALLNAADGVICIGFDAVCVRLNAYECFYVINGWSWYYGNINNWIIMYSFYTS